MLAALRARELRAPFTLKRGTERCAAQKIAQLFVLLCRVANAPSFCSAKKRDTTQ
jgi:hypothetical protein